MRRLTFRYRNGSIELLSEQHVEMTLPAQPAVDPKKHVPFWYELRDAAGGVLHRIGARDPIPADSEVFNPSGSIHRAPVAKPEGVFTVLLPEVEGAETIGLMRSASAAGAQLKALADDTPVEVATFKVSGKE